MERNLFFKPGLRMADAVYVAANAILVGVLALLVFVWQLPALAIILALASKWRVFAVRPRYWGINLRSNLVDLIFIASATALAVHPLAGWLGQVVWLSLLAVWLLVVKRLSIQSAMLLQAAAAQLVGLTALFSFAAYISINQIFMLSVVLGTWLVTYATARHALTAYASEPKTEFFALLWGFMAAQIGWLFSHWLQTYELTPGLVVPQVALILLLLSFCAQRAYHLQRIVNDKEDPKMKKAVTRRALTGMYSAAGFSAVMILIILFTTNWTISI